MHHPESLLIPVLMLCDYWLTVAGARAREGAYAEHFKTRHYELNPLWQKAIARKRWFNLRHLGLTLAFGALFFHLGETALANDPVFDFIIGALFVEPKSIYLHVHFARPGCYAARIDRV